MMKRNFCMLVFLICGWSTAVVRGQEGKSKTSPEAAKKTDSIQKNKQKLDRDELQKVVASLAAALDNVKQAVRDDAEKKLMEIGPSVIEFLPPVSPDASAEWSSRIERLRQSLVDMEDKEFTLASLVTLSGSMSGRKALQQISSQTGNPLVLSDIPQLDRDVITDFEDTPFWEAFDEVLDQIELTVAGGDGESIQFIPRAANAPFRIASAGYSGVFRMEPLIVQKNLQLHDPGKSTVQFQVLLSWEPRLNPVFVKFPMASMELMCDNGEVLKAVSEGQEDEFVPAGGSQMQVSLDFNLPSRDAKKILRWNGKVFITIPGKPATIEFADLMNANKKEAKVGSLSVVLEKTRKNRDIYEVLVALKLSGQGQSAESFRGWSSTHEAFLLDAKKQRVENVGWSTTRMTDEEIGLSYLFDIEKGLDQCLFMVKAPANIVDQTMEFTLEDVPLP